MKLKILTPENILFEGNILKASFPGTKGNFQILKDHAPIISTLEEGSITYDNTKGSNKIMIKKGLVKVLENNITALVEVV